MTLDRQQLDVFLDEVHARILELGPQARLQAHRLWRESPELRQPTHRAELGASLASLLARDAREYAEIREAFLARFEITPADPPTVVETTPGSRARLVGLGLLTLLLGWLFLAPPGDKHRTLRGGSGTPTSTLTSSTSTSARTSTTGLVPVTLEQEARTATAALASSPRPPGAVDWAALAFAVVATVLGTQLIAFAVLERSSRRRAFDEEVEASKAKRRVIERELLSLPVGKKRASRFGLDRAVVVETASLLQRLAQSTYGPGLDGDATARETARRAGFFAPVPEERRNPSTITVLVDAERGDHVWYGAFLRVLDDWQRQGVALDVYRFTGHPSEPEQLATGRRERIDVLGRRARGPLVVFSRRLSFSDRTGLSLWVNALGLWPLRAWVDPEPGEGHMAARDVAMLERQGLIRFPATAEGLRALTSYLVSGGESIEARPIASLPSRADPAVQAALRLWRTAAALVPDPTWDFVERIRQAHPDIARALPERHHVRLLLDEVDAEDRGRERAAGTGSLLSLSEATYRKWQGAARDLAFVRWATELHDEELRSAPPANELEAAERAMLLARNRARREGTLEALEAFSVHRRGLVGPNAELEWVDLRRMREAAGGDLEPDARRLLEAPAQAPVSTTLGRMSRAQPWAWGLAVAAGALVAVGLGARGSTWLFQRGTVAETVRVGAIYRLDLDRELAVLARTELRPAMVRIPAGAFVMGSPDDEPGRFEDEGPQHQVRIERDFWLAETELTQAQWAAMFQARRGKAGPLTIAPNPSYFTAEHGGGPEHPVEQVTWFDAAGFANLLSDEEGLEACYALSGCSDAEQSATKQVGLIASCTSVAFAGASCKGYRLPTEAEWEYAARGGTHTALYTGAIAIKGANDAPAVGAIGWYGGNSGLPNGRECRWDEREESTRTTCGTHAVRTKLGRPHPWGLFDVIGNVLEWTSDEGRTYAAGPAPELRDPGASGWRELPASLVLRGCSWNSYARRCRAASRGADGPAYRSDFVGFRLARSAPGPSVP